MVGIFGALTLWIFCEFDVLCDRVLCGICELLLVLVLNYVAVERQCAV